MIININSSIELKCRKFAKECVGTNKGYYARARNQSNASKVEQDILLGKVCEYAVWEFLGKEIEEPDTEIYQAKDKKHSADLGTDYHIKSCRVGGIISWVYQPKCEYLYTGKHVYCLINKDTLEVTVKYIISGEKLKKHDMYSDPYSEHLMGKKVCVYQYDFKLLDDDELIYIYKGEKNES
ncbi:MAG TPA: hypothetical protein ENI23_03275 [bacterium]|nr:hypothetical protein [bacterium]